MIKKLSRSVVAAVAGLCAVFGVEAARVHAAPEPSAIPLRWQLDVEPGPLRLATFEVGGQPRAFFYFTYLVTNRSGEERYFAPIWELATDDGRLLRAGQGVPLEVTEALLSRLADPALEDQISVIGNLRQGPEHAREGLVIWPAENLRVDEVRIYGTGFSGETKRVPLPTGETQADGRPVEVVLRKTLMLTYDTPGQLTGLGNTPIRKSGERWIMR